MKKSPRRWRRFVIGGVVLLGLIGLALFFFGRKDAPQYLSASVTRGPFESAVLATGTLQAYKQVDVGAQVSGQLKSLKVQLGETVKKDQWLRRD